MKKFFLTLAVAAMCTTSFAGKRILYQQNFDQASDAAATGWSYGGSSMSIASDEYGKFLELSQGQSNGRSAQLTWGAGIFNDAEGNSLLKDGKYTVSYDFCVKQNSNNQYNSEFTVFTNHAPIANNLYRTPWDDAKKGFQGAWNNFLFDMSQVNTAADADMLVTIDAKMVENTNEETGVKSYSLETAPAYTLASGTWYTVTLNVDVNARTVDYTVISLSGDELSSGTYTVPEKSINAAREEEEVSMLAEGLFIMVARYQTIIDIDNISVAIDTDYDYANTPGVALTRLGKTADDELDLNLRAYTCTFLDGETLHIKGTDGKEITVEYGESDNGSYVYETSTSGELEVWTTVGEAKSEVVKEKVECVPVVLPQASAAISSVGEGFAKSYTLSVSNADVPLQPTIFLNYKYVNKAGETIDEKEGVASGYVVDVTEEGTLTITSQAFGYEENTVSVTNDIEFAVKQKWDFARMSDEEIKAAGFTEWQVLNSAKTSGFENWTARKRLYYYDGSTYTDEEGNEKQTMILPFGFVAEDNTTNVLDYSVIGDEEGDKGINVEGYELFKGIRVFANHNVTYLKHIGMLNNSTKGGNNKNIDVLNLDETDFVVVNKINDYGTSSIHPTCATNEEYFAQLTGTINDVYKVADVGVEEKEGEGDAAVGTGKYTVSCPIYRIDTAATCVTVYAQVGGSGVEGVEAEVEGDGYYYTIDGIRLAQPNGPGLYIHNGKKIIVK